MFQITEFIEAKLATVTSRSEKHGDDEKPAVSLGLEMTVPNTILDTIDPKLRPTLYAPKSDETPELPGIEPSTPILRCNSIERVTLPTKHEGWVLAVDDGIDESKASTFGGCKVDKVSIEPMNGGAVVLRMRIGTSDLDAERSGMLGMHVGQSIWITLMPPVKTDGIVIDGTREAFARDHPDAGDIFAQQHGAAGPEEGETDSEGGETDATNGETIAAHLETGGAFGETAPSSSDPQRGGEGWPFPEGAAKTDAEARAESLSAEGAPSFVDGKQEVATAARRSRKSAQSVE